METEILILLTGVIVLLIFSAFFSGSETALMSSSKPKLHKQEKEGDAGAARVNRIISCPETLLSTILLGNNLVNIAASSLTTGLFIKLFGDSGIAYATLIMTFFVLIFAEILPKTIASKNPEYHSIWISRPMAFLIIAFKPFTRTIRVISRFLMRMIGIDPHQSGGSFGEEDVKGAIGMGLEEGVLEEDKHRMLDSVLALDQLTVEDVMTHRSTLQSISVNTSLDELFDLMAKKPCHSRLPMWENEVDNIIGILHVKDFLHAFHRKMLTGKDIDIRSILQEPYFVPENAKLSAQLLEFRKKSRHMSLVVDEYGTLQGLITLEDILEEIVGDIEDEHDDELEEFQRLENGCILLAGTYPVRDANREFGWNLTDEESVTIAGLLIENADGLPSIGEEVQIGNITFTILKKNKQAIQEVMAQVHDDENTKTSAESNDISEQPDTNNNTPSEKSQ